MKLHVFDKNTLKEWRDTGYAYILLTPSENVGLTEGTEEQFILLEPFLDNDDKEKKHENIVALTSLQIEQIIEKGSGKYYK